MKKDYIKPYLAVESFQLDAAIATACNAPGQIALGHKLHDCVDSTDQFFGRACGDLAYGTDVTDDVAPDGLCYQGPVNDLSGIYIES